MPPSSIERLLRLGRGDLRPGLLLFAYLFLVNASCTVGAGLGNGLYLEKLPARTLPYADLTVVVGVMLVASAYLRLGRRVALRNLLVASLLLFALTSVAAWWLVLRFRSAWFLLAAVYVWVGILGVLARSQVWTLVNQVLTLRQAKRLFALVGSGAILGWIAGGAVTRSLTRARGPVALLLAMAMAFTICATLVQAVWRSPARAPRDDRGAERATAPAGGLRAAASMVSRSPYLRSIAVLIGLAALAATITKWQLKAAAQASFTGSHELTAFFGTFDLVAGLSALGVQLVLAAPILRHVGLGGVLSIVPIALGAGSAGFLALGSLPAAAALRGGDQALRYSIDKSAKELLYLPLPRAQTFQVKSFLETIVSPAGDALASVAILLFTKFLGASPSQMAWLTLGLVAAWLVTSLSTHHQYLRNLGEALRKNRVDVQGVTSVLDRATTQLIASHLAKKESKPVLSALSLAEASRASSVLPGVEALLSHSSAAVRARAITVLSASRPTDPPAGIEALLFDRDLRVRSAALLYMARAGLDPLARLQKEGDFEDLSVRSAIVVYLARPGRTRNLEGCRQLLDAMRRESGPEGRRARVEAARLLATLPGVFKEQLAALLADEDPDVVRHAIRAAGRLRAGRFVPRLIDALAVPALSAEAAGALARFGDRVVPRLAECLADQRVAIETRREVPKVLLHVGTPSAERTLLEHLAAADAVLRFQAVSALNKLKRRHPEPPVDVALVEKALALEVLSLYRGYLSPPGTALEPAAAAPPSGQLECVFRLLHLLLPGRDINSAYVGLQSADPVVRDKALEFLDNVLAPRLRRTLVPLIDNRVEWKERAAIAARLCAGA